MLPAPAHTHGSLIVAYILAILTLVLHAVDTFTQHRTVQKRSKKYLVARVLFLVVFFLGDVGLICFIEVDRSGQGTWWVPALWVLLQSSMLLGLSLEVSAALIP
jgi:hypothetical protein